VKNRRKVFSVFMAAMMLFSIVGMGFSSKHAQAADSFDDLRLKWYDMLTGGTSYDPNESDFAAAIASVTEKAQTNWSTMNGDPANRTYLWSDLAALSTNPTHIRLSYERLNKMALAYRTHGSSLNSNEGLKISILDGLKYLNDHYYNTTVTRYGNWWEWEIGTPLALNDTTVLMYDDLIQDPSAPIADYMNTIKYFIAGPRDVGANRVWTAAVTIVRGVISKDGTAIQNGVNGLSPVFKYVTSGDGFYTDGSFIQHEKFAYTGSYGLSLIDNLSRVLYLVKGSAWDVTDPSVANAYKWVHDSFVPVVYKGALMDMVRGRDISVYSREDHEQGTQLIRAILKMAQSAPSADAGIFKRVAKYWLQNDTYTNVYQDQTIDFLRLAKQIVSDSSVVPAAEPSVSKIFPAMDRAVHYRPGFGFGLSMFSSRIANYEAINGQNIKGWYTGAGMTYLYNGDLGQFSGNYWPTVNSYRLPGTTVVANKTMAANSKSTQAWVGGTTLANTYSVAGMSYEHVDADTTADLTAKKSWFLFDDEIVALGAGITSSYPSNAIETVVENRKLNESGSNVLTVNGTVKPSSIGWAESMSGVRWAHLDGESTGSGIGYYFPGGATIKGLREQRSGKWSDIAKYSGVLEPGDPTYTNRFLSLYMDHGVAPANGSYAYALLPNQTPSEVSSYASNPDFIVLANTDSVQAVKEKSLGMIGANFWTNTTQTVDMITSSGRASVLVKENGGSELELSVSDPSMPASGTVTITLDRSASEVLSKDPRITVNRLSPSLQLTVNTGGSKGQALQAKFVLGSPPVTTVVEAESFSSMSGVTVYTPTTDNSGGSHVSGISNGDWMAYKQMDFGVGTDSMDIRLASANTGGTMELRIDGPSGDVIGTYAITSTGGWSSWKTVTVPLSGASGKHDLYMVFKRPDSLGVAIVNWFDFHPIQEAVTTIEGETYSSMSGVSIVNPTTDPEGGGGHVGNIGNGDWIAYDAVNFGASTGKLTLRLAAAYSGGTIEFRKDSMAGPLLGTYPVPSTGQWTNWATVEVPITPVSGTQKLVLVFKRPDTRGVASLNWIRFVPDPAPADVVPPETTPISSPVDGLNGWYVSNPTITLAASDKLSGVADTVYSVDGGGWFKYTGPVLITAEGVHTLSYKSSDKAGNVEEAKSLTVKVDKSAPELKVLTDSSLLWPANHKLVDIRVDVKANDSLSGVGSVALDRILHNEADDPSADVEGAEPGTDDRSFKIRAERRGSGTGRVYTITYTATDLAGNRASASAIVTVPHDLSGY
jgi:hyaluronate lyase